MTGSNAYRDSANERVRHRLCLSLPRKFFSRAAQLVDRGVASKATELPLHDHCRMKFRERRATSRRRRSYLEAELFQPAHRRDCPARRIVAHAYAQEPSCQTFFVSRSERSSLSTKSRSLVSQRVPNVRGANRTVNRSCNDSHDACRRMSLRYRPIART